MTKNKKIAIFSICTCALLSCYTFYCIYGKSSQSHSATEESRLQTDIAIGSDIIKKNCIYWSKKDQKAIVIDDDKVENKIKEVSSGDSKAIVVCCATWCGPCIKLKQLLSEYNQAIHNNIDIIIINSDKTAFDVSALPKMLQSGQQLSGYPTIYCIKGGKISSTIVGFGYSTKRDLETFASRG